MNRRHRAFTMLELMVVVGIILVLVAFAAPSLTAARKQAQRVACASNLRQVTQAFIMYASDNDGQFLSLDTTVAQVGLASGSNNSQVILALYPYLHSSRVFHCPADARDDGMSYVPNDILGAVPPYLGYAAYIYGVPRYLKVGNCSSTYAMIEEFDLYPRQPNNAGGFVVVPAPATIWIDTPAIAHGKGSNISFLDGHCEYWIWNDPRTLALRYGQHNVRTPGDADLARMQAVLGGS